MLKTTNILFTIVFAVGCFWLFLLLGVVGDIYPMLLGVHKLPYLTHFLITKRFVFAVFPIPFLLVPAFIASRAKPTTEITLLHIGVLAATFSLLFLLVSVAVCLPLYNVIIVLGQ